MWQAFCESGCVSRLVLHVINNECPKCMLIKCRPDPRMCRNDAVEQARCDSHLSAHSFG